MTVSNDLIRTGLFVTLI